MAKKEIKVKVVLTKAGDTWDVEKTYRLLDYVTLTDGRIYVSKQEGNKGHELTDAAWWDKTVDLKAYVDAMTAATVAANTAAEGAGKVNAVLGDDNVLTITDRTGAEKSLELVAQAAATEMAKKVEQNAADIAELKEGVKDYYVGENDEVTGDPHFKNCKGNKEFLGEWHPFLIDHTDNTGEATHPVGQLMDNNHFRFVSGAFAPTVGITEAMRAACDVQLYTDAEHTTPLTLKNGVVVTDKAGAHPYDATEVYNSLGLVDLYDGEGNKVRQLLPISIP